MNDYLIDFHIIMDNESKFMNPSQSKIIFRKNKNMIDIIPWLSVGTCGWILLSCDTGIGLSYMVNTTHADDLATQGARASASMVLT